MAFGLDEATEAAAVAAGDAAATAALGDGATAAAVLGEAAGLAEAAGATVGAAGVGAAPVVAGEVGATAVGVVQAARMAEATGNPAPIARTRRKRSRRASRFESESITRLPQVENKGADMLLAGP
jgi:hypothetical protein